MFKLIRIVINKINWFLRGKYVFEDGSYVEYYDFESAMYVEGKHKLWIPTGVFNSCDIKICRYWTEPEYIREEISQEKLDEILAKFIEYLEMRNIEYDTDDPFYYEIGRDNR